MSIVIRCRYDEIVPIADLKPHPKNRNKHPPEQIERLSKMIQYQGCRAPIVVSNQSGYISKGHGTLLALIQAGETSAPVVRQDFETPEQEYAFLQGDNAIAEWAELDLGGINLDLADLGPDLDIEQLGLRDFKVDPAELPDLPTGDKSPFQQKAFILNQAQAEQVDAALKISKAQGDFGSTGNENSNGNALARICETYVTQYGNGSNS